jgi:septum formation protein
MLQPALVLASGSRYRREQLARLGLIAECVVPGIDESRLPDEPPAAMAQRLARAKAAAVERVRPHALIIAADQVAELDGAALGKPGSAMAQQQQLATGSGRELRFHTALVVADASTGEVRGHLDLTVCRLRDLSAAEIARYVAAEPAHDCAGGFKVEGLGITLFERIDSEDPSALIGLPLIAMCRMLRQFGCELP